MDNPGQVKYIYSGENKLNQQPCGNLQDLTPDSELTMSPSKNKDTPSY